MLYGHCKTNFLLEDTQLVSSKNWVIEAFLISRLAYRQYIKTNNNYKQKGSDCNV
jgi:hypothetical protein